MPGGNPGIRVDTICFDKLSKSLDVKADAHAITVSGIAVVDDTVSVEMTESTAVVVTRRPSPPPIIFTRSII